MNRLLNVLLGALIGGPLVFAFCGAILGVLGYA